MMTLICVFCTLLLDLVNDLVYNVTEVQDGSIQYS